MNKTAEANRSRDIVNAYMTGDTSIEISEVYQAMYNCLLHWKVSVHELARWIKFVGKTLAASDDKDVNEDNFIHSRNFITGAMSAVFTHGQQFDLRRGEGYVSRLSARQKGRISLMLLDVMDRFEWLYSENPDFACVFRDYVYNSNDFRRSVSYAYSNGRQDMKREENPEIKKKMARDLGFLAKASASIEMGKSPKELRIAAAANRNKNKNAGRLYSVITK